MPFRPVAFAVLLCLAWSNPGQALELSDCRLTDPSGSRSVAASCGRFQVAENPDDPDGRQIELFVARISTLNQQRSAEAFTLLAGGPGGSATELYAGIHEAMERVRRSHDIILVDQRGTGRSNPLRCDIEPDQQTPDWQDPRTRELLQACLDDLPGDPRYYTTSLAVQDLDAVREALGYSRLVVYGGSYGTRVAQHYMRRFPDRVRAVILDGVVPPQLSLGPGIALAAQAALDMHFDRCEADADCAARFPGLRQDFQRLLNQLRAEPVPVQLANPRTGLPETRTMGYDQFAGAVRLLSYNPLTVALLPLLISEAAAGNYAPLMAQSLMVSESMEQTLSYGMHNAVVCAEDVPFIDWDALDTAALERTYLSSDQARFLQLICEVWPRGVADADIKDPLASDIPVLLLSGEADPVTPPAYAEQAAAGFTRARHLVGPAQGHGLVGEGCVPRLIAEFAQGADPAALAGDCVGQLGPAPFFHDFNGPTP